MNLVNYITAIAPSLPPISAQLYEYIFAANGVFIRAKRSGMEVLWLIAYGQIRGLAVVEPYLLWEGKKIPGSFLNKMLDEAKTCINEVLWYLWQESDWVLSKPQQSSSPTSVTPIYQSLVDTDYSIALVEVHSHGDMPPVPSIQDNADEQGFRIYVILGCVNSHPKINVRIGLAGYFCPIPACMIFEDFDKSFIEDTYEY
ncbi:MAG: Mov34/MPN/PAD-1 family protein [Nostoc sp.]|uniref:Mov34/MPN/PAD-1 family protein n=1 Tax=Nostoc sp. TaxID=1180 RepID=UPI002FF78916